MTRRRFLMRVAAFLAILVYPVVWALGYQEHSWHFHTGADVTAFAALLASTSVHVAGTKTVPPVPRWLTWLAVVVSSAAFASALFWDEMGRPTDADNIGVGFRSVFWLFLGIGAAIALGETLTRVALGQPKPRSPDLDA